MEKQTTDSEKPKVCMLFVREKGTMEAVLALADTFPRSQSELCEVCGISPEAIPKMRDYKLISYSTEDKIFLTQYGQEIADKLNEIYMKIQNKGE